MNEKKLISIVIPTCNRNDFLEICLDKLHNTDNKVEPDAYEIIVTDDSISDSAKALIESKFPKVKWISGPKKGPAANRNNGVANASGEWILFTDDDCQPQFDWISSYQAAIMTSQLGVLEGKTIADRPKMKYDEISPINLVGGNLWSCNFAIKKSLFNEIGGFDEGFPYANMEDTDFYNRLLKLSSVKFVPTAIVMHPWRDMKPFKNFSKRLFSHRYYARKYKLNTTIKFRLVRFKIFIVGLFSNFSELKKYKFKGWKEYFDKCAFDFCMIFI